LTPMAGVALLPLAVSHAAALTLLGTRIEPVGALPTSQRGHTITL
jgi:hypothetical protein